MKPLTKAFSFLAIAVITFATCKKSNDTTIEPPSGTTANYPRNLIANSSFESDGKFSLDKWHYAFDDTTFLNSSNDVPDSGANFSVSLNGTGMPQPRGASISYELSPPVGTHRYRLSFWAKGYGCVSLSLNTPPTGDVKRILNFSNSTWTETSVLDTLTTTSSNTLLIAVGRDVLVPQNSYHFLFDLCRLEQLD